MRKSDSEEINETSRRRRQLTQLNAGGNTSAIHNDISTVGGGIGGLLIPIKPEEQEEFPTQGDPELEPAKDDTESKKNGDYFEYVYTAVNVSITKLVLRELKHYSSYTISVKACREGPKENCSNEVMVQQRTARIGKLLHALFLFFGY